MTFNSTTLAVALAAATALAVSAGGGQAQQNPDDIRAKCISEVVEGSPPTVGDEALQRRRVQLYINCMQRHGLQP
jgi:hypothetical protein